ncbi:hypothetical protein I317_03150 [Kwoniella heveanensis CBS 569]|nr:hypothetical protein I317_03150 [Kwoniella heveanensis CBS 569]
MAHLRQRNPLPSGGPPALAPPIESPLPAQQHYRRQRARNEDAFTWREIAFILSAGTGLGLLALYLVPPCPMFDFRGYYKTANPLSSAAPEHSFGKLRATDVGNLRGQEVERGWVEGHADFGDGRNNLCGEEFVNPQSEGTSWVNVMLGNGGPEPNLSGGMIPAVAPPFGMTRWSPQTRENYVSMCPYNQTDIKMHGFIGTHQPAIWMGESAPSEISAGLGEPITDFHQRGLPFERKDEYASPNYYRNLLDAGDQGKIRVEMTATSRVGHIRYTFDPSIPAVRPHIVVQASRKTWVLHGDQPDAKVPYYPQGHIKVDAERQEVYGWNDERQDHVLVGEDLPANNFKGYFVARFSHPWTSGGISYDGKLEPSVLEGNGAVLAGYVQFDEKVRRVDVRVGVSFISIEQARRNIDLEIPDGQSLGTTSQTTRSAWAQKLDLLSVGGATSSNLTVLYTSFAHTLVYPYEISERTSSGEWAYYSGYLDKVVKGISYSGYSIWDTFRAQTAWLLLVAPERVGEMVQSMIQDWREGGWLPMWKNIVETNIMVGTHSDSVIAQAMKAGVRGFDWDEAWQSVRKDAFTPPDRDQDLSFADREEGTPQEVRAGLTEYMKIGYVAADLHAESGSRTLDYAYDDHAASIVASLVGAREDAETLYQRSKNYKNLWNERTGHMEARNEDGSFAGPDQGWTEGDHWAYSLDVMHDVPGLIELMGGQDKFINFLDRHFEGGHNLHTNEPSHHIPYLYTLAGAPHKTHEWVRRIGESDYNHTAGGMSGNEDCGQMSAWYLFSAMGLYPVDPANATYVLGAPFFDRLTLILPNTTTAAMSTSLGALRISATGASSDLKYVKNLTVDGEPWDSSRKVVDHALIAQGGEWVWAMEGTQQAWG